MLKGKTVIVGVTGSIAAYKAVDMVSLLTKQHADVHVILTNNAQQFITPMAFEIITRNKCLTDTFEPSPDYKVTHIEIAKKADAVIIAPGTANIIGKIANGIADDMLTATLLACRCKKLIAPAMNSNMYESWVVQENLNRMRGYGWEVIEPEIGSLACGEEGPGKLPKPQKLLDHVLRAIAMPKDMEHLKVLVTAGPTREAIDPVRYITNHSTGKMGYAIAKMAMLRGAEVTLISGPANIPHPPFVNFVPVTSAEEMHQAVKNHRIMPVKDIIIKSAAVADYTPETVADNKIKKKDGNMSIPLKRTTDILNDIGHDHPDTQYICGFSMETENLIENSRKKLTSKNIDMVVANSLRDNGAGFGTETNAVTIITRNGECGLPLMSKEEVAKRLLDEILKERRR